MITQSYSSPMLAEGIGAFTSQFKKGGMTKKNTKKKLSSKEIEFLEAYANGGSVGDNLIKKNAYEVGDRIKFIDRFRKEEKDGTLEEINEVGAYVVSYGSGITAGIRGVNPDEVIGAYPKAEPKKKRFGLFAKGGMTEEDKLLKELKKLQRELNSRRLQTYTLGDTSDSEKARQAEREVKAKRFYEILEILRKIDSKKYAKGGEVGSAEKFWNELSSKEKMEWLKKRKDIPSDYKPSLSRDSFEKLPDWIKLKVKKAFADNKIYKYAEGGATDPKPTAQDILKRLGYNIPQSEESQEEEPKIIRGWVDDEPYYFAKGGMSKDNTPKVYIADLTAYNNGQLIGKWFDLTDYSDGAELMQDIQKMLDEQTKKDKFGDVHEEYAVHDYENFPREFYSEYMGESDFDKLISLINDSEDSNLPFDVIAKAMADLGKDEVSEVVEAYFGSVPASMGNEWRDFAYEYVDMVGGISGVSNADYYFDYESFGSDERINMGGEAEEEMGYEDLSDTELGEQLVEEVGGIEALGESTINMYFDYDKFGRDLQYDFTSIRGEDGNYYFFNSNYKKGGKVKSKPEPEDDGEYQLSEEEKKIIRGYVDDEPYYFAEGGNVLKKTTYVPNRDVKELMVVLKGSLTKLSGSDIIDGVYVKNTKLKSAPKENAKELFAQLQKQAKKDDSEIGFDESDIQKLFDAGFSVQDIRNIFFGYTPPIVNADTEFGNTTNGLLSFTADYQKKKMDEIIKISEDGFYEMGLKYPSFSWESIVKKYNIKLKPTIIIDEKSKVFRYKHEVYLGDGIAIGHTISTFRDTWADSGDKIGFLNLKKPTPYQKERDYQAGFNGGYWGIVVKNKEILYDVIDTLLKQDDSYLKDLEVFWNGLGGIDSENVKKQKFAKGGSVKKGLKVSKKYTKIAYRKGK